MESETIISESPFVKQRERNQNQQLTHIHT
jgi:hypothetical protein